jgi:hypothetical protein
VLEELRRLQDVQVTVAIHSVEAGEVNDPNIARTLNVGRPVVLDAKEALALKNSWSKKLFTAPKVTIFNGQMVTVKLPSEDKLNLELSPLASADRRFVRMQLAVGQEGDEHPGRILQQHLKDGHSVLIDLGRLQSGDSPKGRLVMITPKLVVQEEEEELLMLVPPANIVIQEEEELLGIDVKK